MGGREKSCKKVEGTNGKLQLHLCTGCLQFVWDCVSVMLRHTQHKIMCVLCSIVCLVEKDDSSACSQNVVSNPHSKRNSCGRTTLKSMI